MNPIRVALSGSGFKFPAHVGALHAIRDAGFVPIEMAGTSGGSIVATLAACGMDLDQMKTLTLERDWSDMLSFSLGSVLTRMGYCSGAALLAWISENTAGKTFGDLTMDLVVMASDVAAEVPFEFSRAATPDAPVALAARASAAIPFVYAPVEYGDAMLMDGGCCNNIPVDKLTIDIVPRVIDLMLSANENTHVDLAEQQGAHFAFIETGFASGLDRNMPLALRQQLFDNGYAGTTAALVSIIAAAPMPAAA